MVIIQNSIGESLLLTNFTGPIHQAYCDRHGYTYSLLNLPVPTMPPAPSGLTVLSWSKIAGIIQTLNSVDDGEIVLSIDTDTLIITDNLLDNALPIDNDLGLVRTTRNLCGHPSQLNAGVMFIRKNASTVNFFNQCLALGPITNGLGAPGGDQGRINDLIVNGNTGVSVIEIDSKYNSYAASAVCLSPLIRSFHGEIDNNNTLRLLKICLSHLLIS